MTTCPQDGKAQEHFRLDDAHLTATCAADSCTNTQYDSDGKKPAWQYTADDCVADSKTKLKDQLTQWDAEGAQKYRQLQQPAASHAQ